MNSTQTAIPLRREELAIELFMNRRESLQASERGDFRAVGRLTLEAAHLNKAIAEVSPLEDSRR